MYDQTEVRSRVGTVSRQGWVYQVRTTTENVHVDPKSMAVSLGTFEWTTDDHDEDDSAKDDDNAGLITGPQCRQRRCDDDSGGQPGGSSPSSDRNRRRRPSNQRNSVQMLWIQEVEWGQESSSTASSHPIDNDDDDHEQGSSTTWIVCRCRASSTRKEPQSPRSHEEAGAQTVVFDSGVKITVACNPKSPPPQHAVEQQPAFFLPATMDPPSRYFLCEPAFEKTTTTTMMMIHGGGSSNHRPQRAVLRLVPCVALPDAARMMITMAVPPTTTTTMAVAWDRLGAIPVALSAVFVSTTRTTTAASPSPLLQACLKRHLIGLVLLHNHGSEEQATTTTTTTSTTIALDFAQTSWHFQLQTIRCGGGGGSSSSSMRRSMQEGRQQQQQQCGWVRIAPSTICTIVWAAESASSSPAARSFLVPPLELKKTTTTRTTTTTTTTTTASLPAGTAAAAAGAAAALVQEEVESTFSPAYQFLRDTVRYYCQQQQQSYHQQQQQPPPPGPYYQSILLTGPPGVGKTYAVRTIAQQYNIPLHVVSGGNVTASSSSSSSTSTTAEAQMMELLLGRQQPQRSSNQTSDDVATTMAPMRIVFLDECDALFPASTSDNNTEDNGSSTGGGGGGSTMESTLCYCLDQMQNVLLVAATNRPDAIPRRVRMRFHREFLLSPPNRTERYQLLRSLLLSKPQAGSPPAATTTTPRLSGRAGQQQQPPSPPEDRWLEVLADDCVGYVAADLAALVARAHLLRVKAVAGKSKYSLGHENSNDETDDTTENDDLENNNNDDHWHYYLRLAMPDVGASALRAIVPPSTTLSWDDVVGNDHVKKLLRQAIEWPVTKREAFRRLDLQAPRGILLYGPPGCAKTSLAKAAAHGRAFCCYSPADVYSTSYVGDAEAVIRQAFATARAAAPCILFFDELDAIVVADGASSTRGNHVEARVLSTFLNEMDGLDTTSASSSDNEAGGSCNDNNGVLVLAATNRPSVLDAALLRPGRLDRLIYVPPPDDEARRGILHKYTDGMFEEEAVQLSTHMTGAEIVGACREALLKCAALGRDDNIDIVRRTVTQCLREVKPLLGNPAVRESYRESYDTSSLMG